MKQYLIAMAALAAITAQAQLSGPNRTGPGASPGTFQTPGSTESSLRVTTPDSAAISIAPPIPNPRPSPVPRTALGTPDATGGPITDSLRVRSGFPSSRDWETGVGGPPLTESGRVEDRLTPPPDITPRPRPLEGIGATTLGTGTFSPRGALQGGSPTIPPVSGSDLNTTGINTPPRTPEQPLDKALSAKIRAQLSQNPARASTRIAPETVRDLRITSQNGRIVLEGTANSMAEKQMVEARAKEVPGVVGVDNRIMVKNSSRGGRPAAGQTGQAGQTPRSTSELNDDHPETRPDF